MQAADIITSTISSNQQNQLTDDEFNNDYLLLLHLKELLHLINDIQFMQFTQKLYFLKLDTTETSSEFLTCIKLLEKQIDAIKIELTKDK